MIKERDFEIERGGIRLDAALLIALPTSSRTFIREALENGDILVNGRKASKGMKVCGGEKVFVKALAELEDNLVAPDPNIALKCVWEDEAILAFDKPRGFAVHPLSRSEKGTLMNGVVAKYPECAPLGDRPLMAGALHRIDSGTSGLVLVARTVRAFESLRAQFSAQEVEKTYLALVEGCVATGATLENDLIHDPGLPYCRMLDAKQNRLTLAERAKARSFHAVTNFRPIAHTMEENEERTLLEVKIFTGVTHQIRAQLAIAGMHIVNDRLYGAFAVENEVGHYLHALSALFTHPATQEKIKISTALPEWASKALA